MDILFIFCCIVYSIRIFIIVYASNKARKEQKEILPFNEKLPFISVIVPARNEENNISNCLSSLLKSTYPKDKFEIIAVNDRSNDNTSAIISEFSQNYSNVKLVDITEETKHKNLQGKPGALQAGFDAAKGKIFLMTDADCQVNENWIRTLASHFLNDDYEINDKVGMVCAYTNVKGKNIFEKFQDAEWTYMNAYASAGIGAGTVLGCFGNNLAISKEAYYKVGGYKSLSFSITEDYVLLRAVFDAGYKIYYSCDINSNVETLACPNFREYIKQHKRWLIGGLSLGWKAFLYVFSSLCITATFLIAIFEMNPILLAINIILRILGDVFVLFPIYNILDRRYMKKDILRFIGIYSVVEAIMPFTLINRKVEWKGQIFEKS